MKKLMKNKKGLITELLILIAVAFFMFIFFASWKYGFNLITTTLEAVPSMTSTAYDINGNSQNVTLNISQQATNTFGQVNTGLDQLELIGYMIFFGYLLATLILSYYSGQQPVFFFVNALSIIIVTIFSFYVSNAYEEILTNEVIGPTISSYSVATYLMLHLPLIILTIGFIGIILSVVGFVKSRSVY